MDKIMDIVIFPIYLFHKNKVQWESMENLKHYGSSLSYSNLFVYESTSDYHTYSTAWQKPLIEMIVDYAKAEFLWLFNVLGIGRSLNQYELLNFRELRGWNLVFISSIVSIMALIFSLIPDPKLAELFGVSILSFGNTQFLGAIGFLFFLITGAIRTTCLINERNHGIEIMRIYEMLISPYKGGLNERYVKKISRRITPFIQICDLYYSSLVSIGCLLIHIICSYKLILNGLETNEVNPYFQYFKLHHYFDPFIFQITMYAFVGFFFPFVCYYSITTLLVGFITYYMSHKYIQYRFDQLNDLIVEEMKKPKQTLNSSLFTMIREHDEIRGMVFKNGLLMNMVMFIIYYGFAPFLDLLIYHVINVQDDTIIKPIMRFCAPLYTFFLYQFAYCSACLYKSAHSIYFPLNCVMAKYGRRFINPRKRLTIGLYIERLGGPPIATYCWNLFALTNNEFYLFVAGVVSNYFLINEVIQKFFSS